MIRLMTCCSALLLVGMAGGAIAHPILLRFESRGECEREKASVNNYDREYVAEPIFGITHNGQAQVFFLESFRCEYDEGEGLWRMVNHMGDPSGIGRAFDD